MPPPSLFVSIQDGASSKKCGDGLLLTHVPILPFCNDCRRAMRNRLSRGWLLLVHTDYLQIPARLTGTDIHYYYARDFFIGAAIYQRDRRARRFRQRAWTLFLSFIFDDGRASHSFCFFPLSRHAMAICADADAARTPFYITAYHPSATRQMIDCHDDTSMLMSLP